MLEFFWQQKSWKKRVTVPSPPLPFTSVCFSHGHTHTGALYCTSLHHTPKTRHFHTPLVVIVPSHFNRVRVYSILLTSCLFKVFRPSPSDSRVLSRTTSPYAKPPACIWLLHCLFLPWLPSWASIWQEPKFWLDLQRSQPDYSSRLSVLTSPAQAAARCKIQDFSLFPLPLSSSCFFQDMSPKVLSSLFGLLTPQTSYVEPATHNAAELSSSLIPPSCISELQCPCSDETGSPWLKVVSTPFFHAFMVVLERLVSVRLRAVVCLTLARTYLHLLFPAIFLLTEDPSPPGLFSSEWELSLLSVVQLSSFESLHLLFTEKPLFCFHSFMVFDTGLFCVALIMSWNSLCRPGWSHTHRDPYASASWVLELKTCAIKPSSVFILKSLLE